MNLTHLKSKDTIKFTNENIITVIQEQPLNNFVIDDENYIRQSNLKNRLIVIKKLLRIMEGDKILDIGCSSGIIGYSIMKEHSCKIFGIDIDQEKLKVAKQRGLNVKMVNIEKENLPYKPQFFNTILFTEVIEHITEYHHVLDGIYQVLKSEGTLILSTPNLNSGQNILRILVGKDIIPIYPRNCHDKHIRLFSVKSLTELLNIHGFQVEKVKYVNHPVGSIIGWLYKIFCFMFPRFSAVIIIKAIKTN